METVFWNTLNYDNFNLFIRDLSSSVNTNLKYMIEDINKTKPIPKSNKKKKKAEIIIEKQNKKRKKELLLKDEKTIDFLFHNLDKKDPYFGFDKIKTEEGKNNYKFMLLNKYYKNSKYLNHTLNLYFHLKDVKTDNDKFIKIKEKIGSKLKDYDYKSFMLKELGNLLPPLNFWDKGELKLDQWQIDIIQNIKDNKSVILKAPTSSGKTFISMSAGIFHNKVLYICPAEPVAYQIGANFIKMNYKVHYLIEGHAHLSYSEKTNIFVGTPDIIEKYLYKIGTDFNYVVFDEIHNLNKSYENLIYLLDSNFIALSATIENYKQLVDQFKEIYPGKEINYYQYDKRFINQQRWIWDNKSKKLKKIHPCVCLDMNNLSSFKDISFTPNDLAVLHEKLEEIFEDSDIEELIDSYSPDNYFKDDKILTLDDSKQYEIFIKEKLNELSHSHSDKINELIQQFNINYEINTTNDDFVDLFNNCKQKDLLPMILFHDKKKSIHNIFNLIDKQLRDKEQKEYPYYQDILIKKQELYNDYLKRRSNYESNIKIKTKDALTEKNDKMNSYDKTEKQNYISAIINYYDKYIQKSKDKIVLKNLEKEKNKFIENPDFRSQDIYKKHPNFCFTNFEPMSGDEIRSIRKEIMKTTGTKIEYTDPLFQLIKRGIGIYTSNNPSEYNWIMQKLMSQKKLAIILSDKTLCLGIDLPIRTSCFTGLYNSNFTKEDYLQMSGRAGRRGQDNQGNIIFHNITNYKQLMKGNLSNVNINKNKLSFHYRMLNKLNKNINLDNLNIENKSEEINNTQYKLLWYLKDYNSLQFVNDIDNCEKTLFFVKKDERELYILKILSNLSEIDEIQTTMDYKNKLKTDNTITIFNICKDICNSIHPLKYKFIFENCNKICSEIS